jgi:hypothetical protein
MSFRCEECGKHAKKPYKKVVLKRYKKYKERYNGDTLIDAGGQGWEIHKEKLLCKECYEGENK